jgi:PPOX class probable F420-dependent enzyme
VSIVHLRKDILMVSIPEKVHDLFERPIVCSLATLMPDGQPQVNPVWCDYDGQYVRINTARGRQKDRNMTKRAKVTVLLVDPTSKENRWVEVRGHVAEITEEGANDHINQLSHKYTGNDYKGFKPDMVRVIYKIEPDKVVTS